MSIYGGGRITFLGGSNNIVPVLGVAAYDGGIVPRTDADADDRNRKPSANNR